MDIELLLGEQFGNKKFESLYFEGSDLRKDVNIALKEYEWNALDKHIKTIGVSKLSGSSMLCLN